MTNDRNLPSYMRTCYGTHGDGRCYNSQNPVSSRVIDLGMCPGGRNIWAHTWTYQCMFRNETIIVAHASSIQESILPPSQLDTQWFNAKVATVTSRGSA